MKKSTARALTAALIFSKHSGKTPKNVNGGGCGAFALALHEALACAGEKTSIVDVNDRAHVLVKAGRYYFDADGLYAISRREMIRKVAREYIGGRPANVDAKEVDRDRMKSLVDEPAMWNNAFDRAALTDLPSLAAALVAACAGA
jgi:hypothetical protein